MGLYSTLGTLPNLPGGSIVVTSLPNLTNGTMNLVGTVNTIGTLPNLPGGSVVVTGGTIASDTVVGGSIAVTAGTIGKVASIGTLPNTPGGTLGLVTTITNLSNGTIQNSGTVTGVGSVSSLGSLAMVNAGTISMLNAGTVKNDARPARNILSYGTTFGGTAAAYGTLIGSASVGAGTYIWINDVSIVNSQGGTYECIVGFGTALNGTSVLVKGNFGPREGIQKSYPLSVNAGMTNQDLVAYISAAGTIDVNISYFISA